MASPDSDWRATLNAVLPRFGHRNWILVADAAYPAQTAAGVTVLATGAPWGEVVREALQAVREAPHVRPRVWLDAEFDALTVTETPGIQACREFLAEEFPSAPKRRPHAELLDAVAAAARDFEVLVLKTTGLTPYTTVFLELDCAYWDGEREAALRARLI